MSIPKKLSSNSSSCSSYELPSIRPKRRPLMKQFSQDIPDLSDIWLDTNNELNFYLNSNKIYTNTTGPPPIKIAWTDKLDNDNEEVNNVPVIIRKCKEVKRMPNYKGRFTRHASLEKNSFLSSKHQEVVDNLMPDTDLDSEKLKENNDGKTSLNIFLTHNTQDLNQTAEKINSANNIKNIEQIQSKYLQPLIANTLEKRKAFQIRKTINKTSFDSSKTPINSNRKRTTIKRSNSIVLEDRNDAVNDSKPDADLSNKSSKPPTINVIIRPATAAQTNREKFANKANNNNNNSLFYNSKEKPSNHFRPPLIRSLSAPCPTKSLDKGKFLATKRKIKPSKKIITQNENNLNNHETKEWNNLSQNGNEIITMISLLSPSASDNEEEEEEEEEEVQKQDENGNDKKNTENVKDKFRKYEKKSMERVEKIKEFKNENKFNNKNSMEYTKNFALRKPIKSVTFQPASTARSLSNHRRYSTSIISTKCNSNNTVVIDRKAGNIVENERKDIQSLPMKNSKENQSLSSPDHILSNMEQQHGIHSSTIEIDIQPQQEEKILTAQLNYDGVLPENVILVSPQEEQIDEKLIINENSITEEESPYKSQKERQCWEMYCKMTEKGINVSYDTILRGMLTPSEYRMRRRTSLAEEMNLLINNNNNNTEENSQCKIIQNISN